jgi:hypothetical protein
MPETSKTKQTNLLQNLLNKYFPVFIAEHFTSPAEQGPSSQTLKTQMLFLMLEQYLSSLSLPCKVNLPADKGDMSKACHFIFSFK